MKKLLFVIVTALLLVPIIAEARQDRGNDRHRIRDDRQPVSVPEPATLLLLGAGVAGLVTRHIVKKK